MVYPNTKRSRKRTNNHAGRYHFDCNIQNLGHDLDSDDEEDHDDDKAVVQEYTNEPSLKPTTDDPQKSVAAMMSIFPSSDRIKGVETEAFHEKL